MFENRKLLIATKHSKELVIAPVLESKVGVTCYTVEDYDTDILGTFTGEVERQADPLTTIRLKCQLAMEKYDCDLAMASEGSFGPHPQIGFIPADDELLCFVDAKNNLEIVVREISTETNFRSAEINNEIQLCDFARQVKFPSHALIIRNAENQQLEMVKGINDWQTLLNSYRHFKSSYGSAFVETDMRANYNPTRMLVIARAAEQLADKINTLCPACKSPGFGITEAKKGLRCSQCNFPTRSILSYISTCIKCDHTAETNYPKQKKTEDPMYCDNCNP